jgi:hypothetical protein
MKTNKMLATLVAVLMIMSTLVVLNNVTDFKLVEKASATTPGYDAWGNATTDITYGDNVRVRFNTTGMSAGGPYYLYKPIYNCSSTRNADSLDWEMVMNSAENPVSLTVTTPGDLMYLTTSGTTINFDKAGMWVFATSDAINGSDASTFEDYIWVNTSTEYTITVPSDFYYNTTTSKTITVDTGTDTGCMVAIVAPDNSTVYHDYSATGTYTFGPIGNITMAGIHKVLAYKDLDYDPTGSSPNRQYLYDDEDGYPYNGSYGSNFSGAGTFPITSTQGYYDYDVAGPWDPPEKNATIKTFEVLPGQPTITLVNATPVYWGYQLRMEINVTDYEGNGIEGGTVKIRRGSTGAYLGNLSYAGLYINETEAGNYTLEMARGHAVWNNLVNGSWYVCFEKDINSDGTYEWNNTAKFTLTSLRPPVRIKVLNPSNLQIDCLAYTGGTKGPVDTTDITFEIIGRTPTGTRAYYGDDAGEDSHNITITGDILYAPTGTTLTCTGTTWTLTVTPTKPGGQINIDVDWPGSDNGTASATINIINGSTVTPSVEEFTVGDHINLTVTVRNMGGTLQEYARVYLFWDNGASAGTALNDTTGNAAVGRGADGQYTFWITPDDQKDTAPYNITIAAKTPGADHWGYAKVVMQKRHNMMINATPKTAYAGDLVYYDIYVTLTEGGNPDTTGLTVALYDMDGDLVTGDDAWSKTSEYEIEDEEIILSGGTYQIHAYNATHDSQGNNATITVSKYSVVAIREGSDVVNNNVLCWLIDTDVNITFQVTPAGNGSLVLKNMTSSNGSSVGDETEVDIEDGIGTLEGINATTLGNVTFEYIPADGEQRPADGLLEITTAIATPTPGTIYVGESTEVSILITHPATLKPISGVLVGIDEGIALANSVLSKIPANKTTGTDGKVLFGIQSEATGNATIYIKGDFDPNNKYVIQSAIKKTMTVTTDPSVNEGDTFTVEVRDASNNLITDSTVSIKFNGVTYSTNTGSKELTAPSVPESLDYRIEATAEGYVSGSTTIKVIDIPKLSITVTGTKENGVYISPVKVVVFNDKGGLVTGATVTFGTDTATTVGGEAEFSVTNTEAKDFTITASLLGFQDAESVTIKAKSTGTPGFELLTLIAAIGVAFILLRRRRNK